MKLTTDNKQRIMTIIKFILELYKMMMGTFLVLFVPQDCNNNICSITQNIKKTEPLYIFSNIFNFITFIVVFNFYKNELQRENWCIEYLDIDNKKSNNNLDLQIEKYPEIKNNMLIINKKYLRSIYLALYMLIFNFIISTITIKDNNAGSNSYTTIFSFFILVIYKFINALNIGKNSVNNETALSAYLKTPTIYNCIDEDHIIIEEIDDSNNHITP
jgi:hypothetical protein